LRLAKGTDIIAKDIRAIFIQPALRHKLNVKTLSDSLRADFIPAGGAETAIGKIHPIKSQYISMIERNTESIRQDTLSNKDCGRPATSMDKTMRPPFNIAQ
jgi:hypothetical protein